MRLCSVEAKHLKPGEAGVVGGGYESCERRQQDWKKNNRISAFVSDSIFETFFAFMRIDASFVLHGNT